jgi:tripartite-type tricarboxylate transporter receptor subunit TctC
MARIVARPEVQERFAQEGLQALPSASPEEFEAFVRREIPFWAEVVRTAGASVD